MSGTLAIGPHWVDAVIVLTLAEAVALGWLWRRRGRGLPPSAWAANLLSGLCLMLALRTALAGGDALMILALLAASGAVHAFDLWQRWR